MDFPLWMTVEIGGVSKEELPNLLELEGFSVDARARCMMRQDAFTTVLEKRILNLCCCTVRELGFTHMPTTPELHQRIREGGGRPCPAELGPHLCRKLQTEKKSSGVFILMETIADSSGYPSVFSVLPGSNGKKLLQSYYAFPNTLWPLNGNVVFVLAG